jgi:hypothetical protein
VERVCVILSFDLSIGGINGGRRLVTVGKGDMEVIFRAMVRS